MCKINLVSLLALTLLVSACGGGGGSSKPKPVSSATVSSAPKPSSSTVSSSLPSQSSSSSSSSYDAGLKDLADFPIGAAVSNTDSPSYNILTVAAEQNVVEQHFDQMTAGNIMKVSYLHPSLNTFFFDDADAFVDYANLKNMTVHGHALIWHSAYQVPDFMKNWSGTSTDFLAMLDTHVDTIVKHFAEKGNVVSWDVVNEAIDDDNTTANFRVDSPFYIKSGNSADYIERAFIAARAADANVDLYYNDYSTEANGAKMDKVIEMLTDFKARNIPIDGIGFQMHVFLDYPSITDISEAMERVVDLGYKVKISELDVAVNNPYSGGWPNNKVTTFTSTSAEAVAQKNRYCEIVTAYLATVPEALRGGVTVWGTTDANTWLNDLYKGASQYNGAKIAWPLLFDEQYNDKPALRGFADALEGTACTNL